MVVQLQALQLLPGTPHHLLMLPLLHLLLLYLRCTAQPGLEIAELPPAAAPAVLLLMLQ
jgi:hypothetical protein